MCVLCSQHSCPLRCYHFHKTYDLSLRLLTGPCEFRPKITLNFTLYIRESPTTRYGPQVTEVFRPTRLPTFDRGGPQSLVPRSLILVL